MRIAVIGGGISGIAAARVLLHFGHEVVVFERGERAGGIWNLCYPGVRLQNISEHYRLSDFPWPSPPDLHPTREQILAYLDAAVARFGVDLRPRHEVLTMRELPAGWELEVRGPDSVGRERFDFVVAAIGQYSGEPHRLALMDQERFAGRVITDREVHDLGQLDAARVVVVGFGKSAVDMAAFAAERGAQVDHVFRAPRWLIPRVLFGVHASNLVFCRASTVMLPSWVHPGAGERLLHERLAPLVRGFWSAIGAVMRLPIQRLGRRDPAARRRLAQLRPTSSLPFEMRSAAALAPDNYFPLVAAGRIEPHRGEPVGFTRSALRLADGREIECDLVVLSTGFSSPRFPFMPPLYRELLEREPDGVQLYRHLLHPRIPRVAFAGYNHGFLHVPGVEVATLWLCALLRGDLELPAVEAMERAVEEIRAWKREHILFEPSRSCATNTRFHQYLDVMLMDLGLRPYRKSNPIAELIAPYTAADYAGLLEEYTRAREADGRVRRPLPLAT